MHTYHCNEGTDADSLISKTLYYKFDASHFKTAPRASVGGVEIGASESRLRVSPPLPTLGVIGLHTEMSGMR